MHGRHEAVGNCVCGVDILAHMIGVGVADDIQAGAEMCCEVVGIGKGGEAVGLGIVYLVGLGENAVRHLSIAFPFLTVGEREVHLVFIASVFFKYDAVIPC